jgi:uncharacterized protein YbcI
MASASPTTAQQTAETENALRKQRTGHEPRKVKVVVSDDTLVIAMCGALTPAEQAMASSPEGAARVRDFHRRLFASSSHTLREEITRITGLKLGEAIIDAEPTSRTEVQAYTSGTMLQVFQFHRDDSPGDSVR